MAADRPTILVAPDSFKGTLSAVEVAAALAAGIEAGGAAADLCPLADGGEGTMDAFLVARGGEAFQVEAHDPLGRPIGARFALLDGGTEAVVDTAAASGFALLAPDERDPLRATTAGTGELIAAAIAAGARRVLVAAGGSATVDGGRGAIEALGDVDTNGVELVALCDVRTFYEDAARVFGPQKGADAAAVRALSARLDAYATSLPRDPRGIPMTGAAGGLSGGLWATFGAELVPGTERIFELLELDRRLAAADLVVTGEGRLDEQSLEGKVVGELLRRCADHDRELAIVVGENALERRRLPAPPLRSVEEAGDPAALAAAGRRIAATFTR
ncbi:MAG TPA: glycerate kinase [Solirubrobacterales bacterium]|jgi:glycerate kinase|nr:glycerate kinase [Solirubrobacterales bacterium]